MKMMRRKKMREKGPGRVDGRGVGKEDDNKRGVYPQ